MIGSWSGTKRAEWGSKWTTFWCNSFKTEKGIGKIGFISAISHSFCENCNRIRLTSGGFFKQCLHWNSGTDLRSLIRNGITDVELKEVIMKDIFNKPTRHKFNDNDNNSDNRLMYQIGG